MVVFDWERGLGKKRRREGPKKREEGRRGEMKRKDKGEKG